MNSVPLVHEVMSSLDGFNAKFGQADKKTVHRKCACAVLCCYSVVVVTRKINRDDQLALVSDDGS